MQSPKNNYKSFLWIIRVTKIRGSEFASFKWMLHSISWKLLHNWPTEHNIDTAEIYKNDIPYKVTIICGYKF